MKTSRCLLWDLAFIGVKRVKIPFQAYCGVGYLSTLTGVDWKRKDQVHDYNLRSISQVNKSKHPGKWTQSYERSRPDYMQVKTQNVEELRLKHFEWMTNVILNFQDIRKKPRIQGISQVKNLRTSQARNAEVFSNQDQEGSSMQSEM